MVSDVERIKRLLRISLYTVTGCAVATWVAMFGRSMFERERCGGSST